MPHVAFRAGFHLVPGPLAQTLAGHSDAAVQAGRGLFAKDTATWSTDPAVQQKIANRRQAIGDFNSLDTSGRRAVHIHLPAPDPTLLANALTSLLARP